MLPLEPTSCECTSIASWHHLLHVVERTSDEVDFADNCANGMNIYITYTLELIFPRFTVEPEGSTCRLVYPKFVGDVARSNLYRVVQSCLCFGLRSAGHPGREEQVVGVS